MIRTSHTHPLEIAELHVGLHGGAIGVTFAPGKHQDAAMTGNWARDMDADLNAIRTWGGTRLISLIEPWEFEELKIPQLPTVAPTYGLTWVGLPIRDGAAPNDGFLARWQSLEPVLVQELFAGGRLVVHCKGGLGRAGTVASMLMLATGAAVTAEQAMNMVRAVRPGAIETREQEAFLHGWVRGLPGEVAGGQAQVPG
ncbi:cyclin-dependent kinase inhibitor 3 family protein [Stenotrophomonas sp. Marseille-Q5258]|mgnify:CR=1 FL=1|uniref:cyclin-dependent kinase inhibitor 3 family protein n=2 Tax=Stenotrophomonas TaxID=40323 RepID=UPI0021C7E70C|nr:cyclin-dependent kinase inhibitor 3 family protein [Stenotrophomonas sp. Marseille-Q5258]